MCACGPNLIPIVSKTDNNPRVPSLKVQVAILAAMLTHSGQHSQKAGYNSLISLFRDKYSHSGVFTVADYESDICFPKNKMAGN